tara:strand:+ start:524 stop:679 length:156 start_codon:yes stop_codon:yes gene_type:complete
MRRIVLVSPKQVTQLNLLIPKAIVEKLNWTGIRVVLLETKEDKLIISKEEE